MATRDARHPAGPLCRAAARVADRTPGIFAAFWSAISPFIDPVTKAKVVFLRGSPEQQRAQLAEHFDLAQLEDALGGDRPFTWDPAAYFALDSGLAQ